MSDITKCEGEGCPIKEKCTRFTATANEFRQAYFTDSPIKDGKCEMYWGEGNDNIMNQLNSIMNPKKDE